MIFRTEKSVLFVIPWGRHWLIGTTDTDWNLDKAHPAATAADIDYLLEHVNAVLAVPLTREDVEGVYAGLRPLLAGESDQTSKLVARAHRRAHRARPRRGRRRQVDDVPRHGEGRDRRGGRRDRRQDAAVDDRRTSRCSAPRATRPRGTSAARSRARSACTRCASSTCSTATARCTDELLDLIRERPDARRAAAGRRRLPRRRGRLRGLARGRPAPRRRARPPHPHLDRGVGPRRLRRARRRAAHGRRARLGRRRARRSRSSATCSASPPSARRRSSPTTSRPTGCGSRRPTS